MKKLFFSIIFMFFTYLPANAIDWQPVKLFGGVCCHIDVDSIKKTERYYFYNIKFKVKTGDNVVVTLQSALNSPFSARIKIYSLEDYTKLNGDYEHIFDNQTENLETVTYGSVVSAAHKYVKTLDMLKNHKNTIIINE